MVRMSAPPRVAREAFAREPDVGIARDPDGERHESDIDDEREQPECHMRIGIVRSLAIGLIVELITPMARPKISHHHHSPSNESPGTSHTVSHAAALFSPIRRRMCIAGTLPGSDDSALRGPTGQLVAVGELQLPEYG